MPRPVAYAPTKALAGPLVKLIVLPGLLIANAISLTLLMLKVSSWRGSASSAQWVTNNRPTVALQVQIISHILGMLLLQTFSVTMNLGIRTQMITTGVTLDYLKLVNAVCAPRLDWTLNRRFLGICASFWAFTLLVGAIWAPALTPIQSTASASATIPVPAFTNTFGILDVFGDNSSYTKNTNLGTFTYVPEFNLQGLILNHAREASSRTGGINNHTKIDRTGYVYTARSFGMGASAGLNDFFNNSPVISYTYQERGLRCTAACIYNQSLNFGLQEFQVPSDWDLQVYNVFGTLPNGDTPVYGLSALKNTPIAVMGAGSNNESSHMVVFTTSNDNSVPGKYSPLKNVQCNLSFKPTLFTVSVNVTNSTIAVTPQGPAQPSIPIDYFLANSTVRKIGQMASMLGSSQWTSVLGDIFMNNIWNVESFQGPGNATSLLAIASSIEAIVDDILASFSAAQLVVLNNAQQVHVSFERPAFVFGNTHFIIATLAISLLITLFYLFEVVRTGFWRGVPSFDPMDTKAIVLASSAGGTELAEQAQALTQTNTLNNKAGYGRELLVELKEDDCGLLLGAVFDDASAH